MIRYHFFTAVFASVLVCSSTSFSQTSDTSFHLNLFPPGLHFVPLKANIKEPRIGIYKFTDHSTMKVDIGNSIDILSMENKFKHVKISTGIDFIGYALTDAFGGFRLQIDALDGLFGGNVTASKEYENSRLISRFRLLHHSAHYVDGHYDFDTFSWIDGRFPSAFTRDFGEIIGAYELQLSSGSIKIYGGYSHATLIRPVYLGRDEALLGGEWWTDEFFPRLLDNPTNLYLAYQLTISSTPVYVGANQIQVGCKFGNRNKKGATLYLAYYTGPQMFGQYVDQRISGIGAGFMIDFF